MNQKASIGDALFTKTQQQVLQLLFGQPDRSFYANEIVRFASLGIGTVQRELVRFADVGLLTVTRQGNQKHYRANPDSPIFEELRGIVLKTFGIADVLKEVLLSFVDQIKAAFIYGSVAKGEDVANSDVDIMLIGEDFSYVDLMEVLAPVEGRLGRALNPTVYSEAEMTRKLNEGNSFLERVLQQPKIMLIGSMDGIRKSRESCKG